MSAAEGASEASSPEQAKVVRANERTDERVAQYLHLYSCLFQTTVQWRDGWRDGEFDGRKDVDLDGLKDRLNQDSGAQGRRRKAVTKSEVLLLMLLVSYNELTRY